MKIIENINRNKNFYATVASLNLGALCMGLSMGWPSPSFTNIYDNQKGRPSFFNQTETESAINVGASVGSLVSVFVTDMFGRRMSFYLSAGISFGFWILLALSGHDRLMIVLAAAVAGLGCGIYSATAVLYVSEISFPDSRGQFGASVVLFQYLGMFVISLCSHLIRITHILSAVVVFPLLFFVTIHYWMIESPYYLFQMGKVLDSKIALKKLRDCKGVLEVYEEFKSMEAFFNSSHSKNARRLIVEAVCPKTLKSSLVIIIPVLSISQMLGLAAASDYAFNLIEIIYPSLGKLFTSFIDFSSTICCFLAIERFGRKPLLAFSSIGSGLCCLTLSIYMLVGEKCSTRELKIHHTFLPIAVICIYYAVYALGMTPVLPIITGEIFPCRAKTAAVGISTSILYFLASVIQMSYAVLNRKTNSCLAFVSFTLLGSIGLPFALTLLPETKGKSFQQIQNELGNFILTNTSGRKIEK